jgi:hypothetical protein
VFCRETGIKEEEEDVEALEGVCNIVATDMLKLDNVVDWMLAHHHRTMF